MLSLVFDLPAGLWSKSTGMIIAAFKAIDSRAVASANALNNLASSETKDFPAFPLGTLKRCGFQ